MISTAPIQGVRQSARFNIAPRLARIPHPPDEPERKGMSTVIVSSSLAVPRLRQRRSLHTRARRAAGVVAPVRAFASAESSSESSVSLGRRSATALVLGLAAAGATTPAARADENGIKIIAEKDGFGSKVAKPGDLVLVNYYGKGGIDERETLHCCTMLRFSNLRVPTANHPSYPVCHE